MEVNVYCHRCGVELEVTAYLYEDDLVLFVNTCKCVGQNHKIIVCRTGKDRDDYNKIVVNFV